PGRRPVRPGSRTRAPSTRLRRLGRLLRRCADRRRVRESPVFPDRGLGDRDADAETFGLGILLAWPTRMVLGLGNPHASNRLRTVTIAKLDGPHPDRRMP